MMLMKTLLDAAHRQEILQRLEQVPADRRPFWGSMNAAQMVGHVTDTMRAPLGELQAAPKKSFLQNPILRHAMIYWIPFPKGVPTAPEFVHSGQDDFAKNMSELKGAVDRFVARASRGPLPPHVIFGDISNKDWGVQMYKHIDHHLRQFGA
jgi:uncharacterized protein DUF1569